MDLSQDRIPGLACVNCNISLEEVSNSTKATKICATFGSVAKKTVVNVFEAISLILNTPIDSSETEEEEGIACRECGKLLELAYNSYREFLSVSKPGSTVFALLEETGRDALTSQYRRRTIKTNNDNEAGGNARSRSVSRRKGSSSQAKEFVVEASADLSRKKSKRKNLGLELPCVTANRSKHDDDQDLGDDLSKSRLPRARRSSRLESISIEFGAEEFPEDEFRDGLDIQEDTGDGATLSPNSDKFNCRLCEDVRFNKYEDLKEHYTRLHPLLSVWSQKEKEEGSQTQRGDTKLLFKCEVCEKRFPRHDHMTLHLRTHTGEKPYECTLCSKTFSDPRGLTYHEVTHSNDRPYCCTLCGLTFKRLHHLNDHEKNHRDTSRPFKCSTCGKSFKCKKHLKSHSVIHEDAKEHRCEVCRKAFNRKDNLRQHVKNVHAKKSLELSQSNKTSYLVLVNS